MLCKYSNFFVKTENFALNFSLEWQKNEINVVKLWIGHQ
jgi:hypothetical protein